MEINKNYFYVTIHFFPDYRNDFICINSNCYMNILTKEMYQKRLLYDFGWGQETGFELLPPLSFDELIKLVEKSVIKRKKSVVKKYSHEEIKRNRVNQSNLFGAISVIMQDHVEELIEFLTKKIDTDYFSDADIRNNYIWFSFDSNKMRKMGYVPGGIGTKSYDAVFNQYEKWKTISERVIAQIYQ